MLFSSGAPAQATSVGVATIKVADPVGGGDMPGFVFYPSSHPAGQTTAIGPYQVAAAFGAPEQPGAKPLVVISHGHGGSALGHHDLATYLASHGFIVATFEHPGDNFHDTSGLGKSTTLVGRPIQVKATISALLHDPRWKASIDNRRIGVAGFSAGGYTSLLVVGAKPTFHRFIDYCRVHPSDPEVCVEGLKRMEASVKLPRGDKGGFLVSQLQKDLSRWGDTADPRVKAAFVMAPLGLIFDRQGMASVDRPVFLYYGQNDHVLLPQENVLHIQPMLQNLDGIRMVPKADHWVFLAPCSAQLTHDVGAICRDPAGVDRVRVHKQINADALAFFRRTLAVKVH
jgi:predicted dienelactone hydrolase